MTASIWAYEYNCSSSIVRHHALLIKAVCSPVERAFSRSRLFCSLCRSISEKHDRAKEFILLWPERALPHEAPFFCMGHPWSFDFGHSCSPSAEREFARVQALRDVAILPCLTQSDKRFSATVSAAIREGCPGKLSSVDGPLSGLLCRNSSSCPRVGTGSFLTKVLDKYSTNSYTYNRNRVSTRSKE